MEGVPPGGGRNWCVWLCSPQDQHGDPALGEGGSPMAGRKGSGPCSWGLQEPSALEKEQ